MQIIRPSPGKISWITQIRKLNSLKYLHHEVGISDLTDKLLEAKERT